MTTKPVDAATPEEYIARLAEPRRSEVQRLHDVIREAVPELQPSIAAGMIGYGTYRYRYATGREGEWPVIAMASNKQSISVYISAVKDGQYVAESRRAELPRASIGKSCIRIKRTSDIDLDVLASIVKEGADAAKAANYSYKV
jgi:hypothetical protein